MDNRDNQEQVQEQQEQTESYRLVYAKEQRIEDAVVALEQKIQTAKRLGWVLAGERTHIVVTPIDNVYPHHVLMQGMELARDAYGEMVRVDGLEAFLNRAEYELVTILKDYEENCPAPNYEMVVHLRDALAEAKELLPPSLTTEVNTLVAKGERLHLKFGE